MDSKDEASPGVSRSAIAWFASAALISYLLLLGPAVRVHDSCPLIVQRAMEVIYAPIEWLHHNAPIGPLEAYIQLWRR